MSYLHLKVPPTRDVRLKPCNAFGGKMCDLVSGQKAGCLSSHGRTFARQPVASLPWRWDGRFDS